MTAQRQNQWFLPSTDIAREVITADIQRYLGNDALVRPGMGTGEHEGMQGFWITAYRTLTTEMITDLKSDSRHWRAERDRQPSAAGRGNGAPSYAQSSTHAARQYNGPTHPHDLHTQPVYGDPQRGQSAPSRQQTYPATPGYTTEQHYVTTPSPQYPNSQYQAGSNSATPRTAAQIDYYHHQPAGRGDGRGYQPQQPQQQQQQQAYAYPAQTALDAYGRPTTAPVNQYTAQSSTNNPEYYTASDGRQYLRTQQPAAQSAPNPQSGASGGPRYR